MTAAARSALFLGAAAIAAVAVVSPPFDAVVDRSFAWHMVQHLSIVYVVALLIVAANPFALLVRITGKKTIERIVRTVRPLHAAAAPWVTLPVFVSVLWIAHFSPLYELALERPWAHIAEHVAFLAAGIGFWLPVLAPAPLRPLGHAARVFYLVAALPQGSLLGMVLFSARAPLYSHYVRIAGRTAALADQHVAAAIMWMSGGIVVLAALSCTLASWAHRESDRSIAERHHPNSMSAKSPRAIVATYSVRSSVRSASHSPFRHSK